MTLFAREASILFLLFSLFAVCSCYSRSYADSGENDPDSMEGRDFKVAEWRKYKIKPLSEEAHFVSIGYSDPEKSKFTWTQECAGTLIHARAVLTYASCVLDSQKSGQLAGLSSVAPAKDGGEKPTHVHRFKKFIYPSGFLNEQGVVINESLNALIIILEEAASYGNHLLLPRLNEMRKVIMTRVNPYKSVMYGLGAMETVTIMSFRSTPPYRKNCEELALQGTPNHMCVDDFANLCLSDRGSPLFLRTFRGDVLLAFLTRPLYDCESFSSTKKLDKRPRSILASVTSLVPWILSTLIREVDCFCQSRNMFEWRFLLRQKLKPSPFLLPGQKPGQRPSLEDE